MVVVRTESGGRKIHYDIAMTTMGDNFARFLQNSPLLIWHVCNRSFMRCLVSGFIRLFRDILMMSFLFVKKMEKEQKKVFKQASFNSRDRRKHGRKTKIGSEMLALKKIDAKEIEDLEKRIKEEAPQKGVNLTDLDFDNTRQTQLPISENKLIQKKKKKMMRQLKMIKSITWNIHKQNYFLSCLYQNEHWMVPLLSSNNQAFQNRNTKL